VLADGERRVLLARRAPSAHLGGLWEFPGGKIEPGEEEGAALARELAEELGIEVLRARPLIRVCHAYPERRVALSVWWVEAWRGEPRGREGQALAWIGAGELADRPMPAADRPVVRAVLRRLAAGAGETHDGAGS